MPADDVTCYGKPEATSARSRRHKGLEYPVTDVLWNAAPIVENLDHGHSRTLACDADRQPSRRNRRDVECRDAVDQEIVQCGFQQGSGSVDLNLRRANSHLDPDLFGLSQRP